MKERIQCLVENLIFDGWVESSELDRFRTDANVKFINLKVERVFSTSLVEEKALTQELKTSHSIIDGISIAPKLFMLNNPFKNK